MLGTPWEGGVVAVQFSRIRVDTMLSLYKRLASERVTDLEREVMEMALDLTLNDARQAESVAYLYRSVMRNARYTLLRRAEARRSAAAKWPLADSVHRRAAWRDDTGAAQAELVDYATPEAYVLAAETLAELRAAARAVGAYGETCLDALLDGRSAAETASLAGVSVTTVERCWRALRAHARAMLSAAA